MCDGCGATRAPTSRGSAVLTGSDASIMLARRAFDRLCEMLGRLRTLYGNAITEDEAGHSVDSRFLGGIGVPRDALHVLFAREARAYAVGIEAARGRRRDQHVAIGEIAAFGELEVHQALLHARGITYLPSPQNQTMAIERVGLALDVVGVVAQSLRRRGQHDPLCDGAIAFR
jgi:hypothetical protein